jgi:ABC transport system ATP-binding/permease protein
MHLLSLEDIAKSYPETSVLEHVSLGISDGERIGVIGRNGSGKSTLLRIISGVEEPDAGSIVRARGLRVSALDQDPRFDPDAPIGDILGGHRPSIALGDRLGLTDPSATCGSLSGGQRKRLALAVALAADADLVILDEPTNHLDVEIIDWLEDHLVGRAQALLLVTHDRYLLDHVATRIVEVHDHTLHPHHGTYEDYLEHVSARAAREAASEHKRQRRIQTELAWLRRSPKARTSKSRHRIHRAERLMARQQRPLRRELEIGLPSRRIGSKVVNLHNVGKRYDDRWVLRNVSYRLQRDARIGIVGPNGSGKTTLLRLIAGRIDPDEGKVVTGSTIHTGWYGQDPRPIPASTRVVDVVRDLLDEVRLASGISVSGAQMLERFQFSRDQQRSTVGDLSGGERRRLELLLSLMEAPNLLLMDEPTNDLDIETLEVLEEYLDGWDGAVVVASHDRYFLDRVCDDLFSIEPDGSVRHHPGGWTAYRAWTRAHARSTSSKTSTRTVQPTSRTKRALTFAEQRALDALTTDIPRLERRISDLTDALNEAASDHRRSMQIADDLAAAVEELDTAETRWLELAEEAERLAGEAGEA